MSKKGPNYNYRTLNRTCQLLAQTRSRIKLEQRFYLGEVENNNFSFSVSIQNRPDENYFGISGLRICSKIICEMYFYDNALAKVFFVFDVSWIKVSIWLVYFTTTRWNCIFLISYFSLLPSWRCANYVCRVVCWLTAVFVCYVHVPIIPGLINYKV